MLNRLATGLSARLGEFWFNSLMLFCAGRAADAMNVFVGLWLVPKYVGIAELGAIQPLTTFATFLALPASVFAMTFMKEVNTLAVHREFGRMKTLIRGVFLGVGAFLVLAIVAARFLMPLFLERIRIVNGSLGVLILAAAFIGCAAPVYTNALQALKRFKAISVISLIGAPVRLVTMLVAMPFRPLSGYFAGQSATPGFSMVASVLCLRRELSVPAEPYWTKPVIRRFAHLFLGMAAYQMSTMLCGLVEATVLRQRLPEVESAAYYMVTRFSDISSFISTTLLVTLFPYTAELAERGKSTRPLVLKSSLVMLCSGVILAAPFAVFGRRILALLPDGESYADFAWAIPWMIGINVLSAIQTFHTNTEASAGRFGFLKWWIPVNLAYLCAMQSVAGYGYFAAVLPEPVTAFLAAHNFHDLSAMLWWMTAIVIIRTLFCALDLSRQKGTGDSRRFWARIVCPAE